MMKITATTLGETGGDWLSMTMNMGYLYSTLIFSTVFVAALATQLASAKYFPPLYWTVIIATSTAGTTMSDFMDRSLQLGYAKGSAILIALLLVMLGLWRSSCGTLNVNSIRSRKAEAFYWVTILFSNTLGTALGDFLSEDSGLGFLGSWLLISSALLLILGLTYLTKVSRVLLFWVAFILTRPFGATFGDVLTKAKEQNGLDLGRGYSSLILLTILVFSLILSARRQERPS
ncbi:MAG: hypothetical protein C5B49_14710 [Bdellovibrio sp.]|nr:MAG: hypothetical protein C5B49_14710 [Bdellovibrio sp.]